MSVTCPKCSSVTTLASEQLMRRYVSCGGCGWQFNPFRELGREPEHVEVSEARNFADHLERVLTNLTEGERLRYVNEASVHLIRLLSRVVNRE